MGRPPRHSKKSLRTSGHWRGIGAWSALVAACVPGALRLGTSLLEDGKPIAARFVWCLIYASDLAIISKGRYPISDFPFPEITGGLLRP